jgi:hypothetical protein
MTRRQPTARRSAGLAVSAGDKPEGYARVETYDETVNPHSLQQIHAGQGGKAAKSGAGLNLRAVADVLESYGLDPIEEVAKVLTARDADGKPLLDEATRIKTNLELAKYVRPQLKAIEVTHKAPELTPEQVEMRLEALLTKQKK